MKEQITNCPLCGAAADVFMFVSGRLFEQHPCKKTYQVECTACGAKGPEKQSRQEAVACWNVRQREKAMNEEIQRLRFQMEKLAEVSKMEHGKEIARMYLDDWHKLYREINELRRLLLQAGAYVYRHAERQVGPATRLIEQIEETLQQSRAAAEK